MGVFLDNGSGDVRNGLFVFASSYWSISVMYYYDKNKGILGRKNRTPEPEKKSDIVKKLPIHINNYTIKNSVGKKL